MRPLHRARLVLVVAAVLALAIVVLETPFSTLVHQRSAVAAAAERLHVVQAENARLSHEVAALHRPSTVASIAHAEYGLVKPGQVAYEIPGLAGARSGDGSLNHARVPAGDLVPATVSPLGTPGGTSTAPHRAKAGLWTQVVDRLAFWRSAF